MPHVVVLQPSPVALLLEPCAQHPKANDARAAGQVGAQILLGVYCRAGNTQNSSCVHAGRHCMIQETTPCHPASDAGNKRGAHLGSRMDSREKATMGSSA